MSRARLPILLALPLAGCFTIPDNQVVVVNRAGQDLQCQSGTRRTGWSAPFIFRRSEQLTRSAGEPHFLRCGGPAGNVEYRLHPGARLLLVRNGDTVVLINAVDDVGNAVDD